MPKLGTRWRVGSKKGIWGREQERGESHRRRQAAGPHGAERWGTL